MNNSYSYSNKDFEDLNNSISNYQYYKPNIPYEQTSFHISSDLYNNTNLYERHNNFYNSNTKKPKKKKKLLKK